MKKLIAFFLVVVMLTSCSRKFTPTNLTPEQAQAKKELKESRKQAFNTILLWNFIVLLVMYDIDLRNTD